MSAELGVFGFGDLSSFLDREIDSSAASERLDHYRKMASETEAVGLDVFGVGEHHRPDFAISAPPVVLGALSEHTSRIRLVSVLTVLATDDPRRVLEQFATLDVLSGGRVELAVGRDAFPEAFAQFGHRVTDADRLLRAKLAVLLNILDEGRSTDRARASTRDEPTAPVSPRPGRRLRVGVYSGRDHVPVDLAAEFGLPLTVNVLEGSWGVARQHIDRYRDEFVRGQDHGENRPHVTVLVPAHASDSAEQAAAQAVPFYSEAWSTRELRLGPNPPLGPMLLGDAESVAEQLIAIHSLLRPDRILLEVGRGNMPIDHALQAIGVLGHKVAPIFRLAVA